MSLHFTLRVNDQSIGHTIAITRTKPQVPVPSADTTCHYKVDHYAPAKLDTLHRRRVHITHRYGDGAMELARKALNALAEEGEQ